MCTISQRTAVGDSGSFIPLVGSDDSSVEMLVNNGSSDLSSHYQIYWSQPAKDPRLEYEMPEPLEFDWGSLEWLDINDHVGTLAYFRRTEQLAQEQIEVKSDEQAEVESDNQTEVKFDEGYDSEESEQKDNVPETTPLSFSTDSQEHPLWQGPVTRISKKLAYQFDSEEEVSEMRQYLWETISNSADSVEPVPKEKYFLYFNDEYEQYQTPSSYGDFLKQVRNFLEINVSIETINDTFYFVHNGGLLRKRNMNDIVPIIAGDEVDINGKVLGGAKDEKEEEKDTFLETRDKTPEPIVFTLEPPKIHVAPHVPPQRPRRKPIPLTKPPITITDFEKLPHNPLPKPSKPEEPKDYDHIKIHRGHQTIKIPYPKHYHDFLFLIRKFFQLRGHIPDQFIFKVGQDTVLTLMSLGKLPHSCTVEMTRPQQSSKEKQDKKEHARIKSKKVRRCSKRSKNKQRSKLFDQTYSETRYEHGKKHEKVQSAPIPKSAPKVAPQTSPKEAPKIEAKEPELTHVDEDFIIRTIRKHEEKEIEHDKAAHDDDCEEKMLEETQLPYKLNAREQKWLKTRNLIGFSDGPDKNDGEYFNALAFMEYDNSLGFIVPNFYDNDVYNKIIFNQTCYTFRTIVFDYRTINQPFKIISSYSDFLWVVADPNSTTYVRPSGLLQKIFNMTVQQMFCNIRIRKEEQKKDIMLGQLKLSCRLSLIHI